MSEEEYAGKWQTSLMECNQCASRWVAVAPVVTEYYECPICQHMNPAPYSE